MSVWSCTQNAHAILKEQEFYDILMIKVSHIFIIILFINWLSFRGRGVFGAVNVFCEYDYVYIPLPIPSPLIKKKWHASVILPLIFYLNH